MTLAEKEHIHQKDARCGISVPEHIRQHCLGYEPRAIPPDAFYELFRDKLDALRETVISPGGGPGNGNQ